MQITHEALAQASYETLFLQARQLLAIRQADPRLLADTYAAFDQAFFGLSASLDTISTLLAEGEALYFDREGEDDEYLSDAEALRAVRADAATWFDGVRACLDHAATMKAPDVDRIRRRLQLSTPDTGTASSLYNRLSRSLRAAADLDLKVYKLDEAQLRAGADLLGRLRGAPEAQATNQFERIQLTDKLRKIADKLREAFYQIASANHAYAGKTGAYWPGFAFGTVKGDAPDGEREIVPPTPVVGGPVLGLEGEEGE